MYVCALWSISELYFTCLSKLTYGRVKRVRVDKISLIPFHRVARTLFRLTSVASTACIKSNLNFSSSKTVIISMLYFKTKISFYHNRTLYGGSCNWNYYTACPSFVSSGWRKNLYTCVTSYFARSSTQS